MTRREIQSSYGSRNELGKQPALHSSCDRDFAGLVHGVRPNGRLTRMELVVFITTETGDDLILSFAVQCPRDLSGIESLILLRTPKYEFILEEHERGVKVSFERHRDDGDGDLLERFEYVDTDRIVRIRTDAREYELDVRKVDEGDLRKMCKLVKRMNYDGRFQTADV